MNATSTAARPAARTRPVLTSCARPDCTGIPHAIRDGFLLCTADAITWAGSDLSVRAWLDSQTTNPTTKAPDDRT